MGLAKPGSHSRPDFWAVEARERFSSNPTTWCSSSQVPGTVGVKHYLLSELQM